MAGEINEATGGTSTSDSTRFSCQQQASRKLPRTMSTSEFLDEPLTTLEELLSRSYWKRLWIIQELALNHNMTLFLCDEMAFSHAIISRTRHFIMGLADHIDQ